MCSQHTDDPKNSPFSESMNVPFIVRFPGKIKPRLDDLMLSLENFKKLFQYPDFYKILGNTLILGALKTFLTFPIPVILALINARPRFSAAEGNTQNASAMRKGPSVCFRWA